MRSIKIFLVLGVLFFLLSSVSAIVGDGIANCESKFENVAINTKEGYPIGEPIGDIKIQVVGNVPLNLPYDAFLYKETVNSSFVDSNRNGRMAGGNATLSFTYTPMAEGKLIIVLIAGEDGEIREEKEIIIGKTFDLKLFCPIANNFIGSPITCTWTPTDAQSNQLIQIQTPIPTVTQGITTIPAEIRSGSLSFTTTTIGSVTVKLEASAEGYLDDVDEIIIQIGAATYKDELLVDNQNYFLLAGSGIDTGTHSFVLKITKGNMQADVQRIDAAITTPSGEVVPLNFIEASDGWRSTFNFEQPGQKYVLRGNIEFSDTTVATLPFNYDLLTLSAQSEKEKSVISSVIIWVSVAVGAIIIIFVVIGLLRRRKK